MEKGHVIMSSLKSNEIVRGAEIVIKNFNHDVEPSIHPDYQQKNVSQKIINIIQSYTHYVNRKNWFK